MRNLVHTKADKEMQLYILQKDFQFDIKQKMSLILLEQGMYTEQQNDGKFRAMTVKNVCMSMVDSQNRGITFVDDDGTIAIVCFEKDDDDSVLEQIEELSDVLKDEFEYKPKITVGSAVQGFENLAISYNDARYLLEHEKKNIQDIIQTMGAQNKKKIFWEIYAELRNIMISNIGTPDYVLKAFNTFIKATESYNLSPSAVRRCCFEIASSLIFPTWKNRVRWKKESWMHSPRVCHQQEKKRPVRLRECLLSSSLKMMKRMYIIPFPMPDTI